MKSQRTARTTLATKPAVVIPVGAVEQRPTVVLTEETGYSLLLSTMTMWNGTQQDVTKLSTLQYPNGDYIVDVKRKDVFMEILGMLQKYGFTVTYDFLSRASDPDYVIWEQKSMEAARNKFLRETSIQFAEPVGIEGIAVCQKCGSKKVAVALRQTRSGDEPMTTFYKCVQCGAEWRQK